MRGKAFLHVLGIAVLVVFCGFDAGSAQAAGPTARLPAALSSAGDFLNGLSDWWTIGLGRHGQRGVASLGRGGQAAPLRMGTRAVLDPKGQSLRVPRVIIDCGPVIDPNGGCAH